MKKYLKSTPILNFNHASIQQLIHERGWKKLAHKDKVKQVYNFVRDEIKFGYNVSDDIKASQVLQDGYGQCNTKAILLMALLRAIEIPNRIHGFTIEKPLQKGAITGIWYLIAPQNILHSWVEVLVDEEWYFLEGVILDKEYLNALQTKFANSTENLCGYGVYTKNFQKPVIDWNLNNTFIQEKGINQDFGLFDNPDAFYAKHKQNLGPLKKWMFQNYIRHIMNENVNDIRKQKGAKR